MTLVRSSRFAALLGGGRSSLASRLLGTESNGLAIDFTDLSIRIKDSGTPANNFSGKLANFPGVEIADGDILIDLTKFPWDEGSGVLEVNGEPVWPEDDGTDLIIPEDGVETIRWVPRDVVYVDSVAGDDGENGTSANEALQTLGAAVAAATGIGNGAYVVMKAGSLWRESFDLSALSGVTVYGADVVGGTADPPIVTGFDVVSTEWTQDETFTNLWYVDVAHNSSGSNRLAVLDDGELMFRRTTLSLANDNVGSYFTENASSGNPLRVYINAGGEPNGDNHVYEVTTRHNAILLGDDSTIKGVVARGAISNNGPLETGLNSVQERCVAAFGTKHNLLIRSGIVRDVVMYDFDNPSPTDVSNNMAEAFHTNATGLSVAFERVLGYTKHTGNTNLIFFAHSASDPANRYASISFSQCIGYVETGANSNGFGAQASVVTASGCCIYGNAGALFSPTAGQLSVSHSFGQSPITIDTNRNNGGDSLWSQVCFVTTSVSTRRAIQNTDTFDCVTDHATLYKPGAIGAPNVGWGAGTTPNGPGTLTVTNSILGGSQAINVPNNVDVESDGNTFARTSGGTGPSAHYHGTDYNLSTNFAGWQAATGGDGSSIVVTSDPFTGTVTDGDFRVDGTVLAGSGCTEHWDYNLRQIVSGPPERWPVIPTSMTEAVAYIKDPEGWDFYP